MTTHDNWATPKDLYDKLDARFHFDFDPCPLFGKENGFDGLSVDWGGGNVLQPAVQQDRQAEVYPQGVSRVQERQARRYADSRLHFNARLSSYHQTACTNRVRVRAHQILGERHCEKCQSCKTRSHDSNLRRTECI